MRHNRANASGDRSNALWGRGSRGEARSNALWGRGGRRAGAALLTTFAVMIAMAALAVASPHNSAGGNHGGLKAYVEDSLLASVQQNPKQSFDVIVQGDPGGKAVGLLDKLFSDKDGDSVGKADVRQQFTSINGLEATLTGKQILHLAKAGLVRSIMANESAAASGVTLPNYNTQLWSYSTGAVVDWTNASLPKLPTIAIVDSGIDTSKTADFGSRIIGSFNFVTPGGSVPNSPGDGYGHGTFVAGIAAGSAPAYAGVAPKANILSLDVMNDQGMASVADILKACDWILANRVAYNIKVANFSLHAVNRASVMFDPLDQAVEKLWLSGIFVVAASGNYAQNGLASGVPYAPGNDPFIMTVGAADIGTTVSTADDTVAPWSAWGYTPDGFSKPDLAAPGRYIVGPVPANGVLPLSRPGDVVAPGYMQLSGTSFSAPMVAGAAAMLLDKNPNWTPDQLKGALMMTASPTPAAPRGSLGVGELSIPTARKLNPNAVLPNPNAGLDQFITTASDGVTKVFNAAAWQSAAQSNAAWDSAAWSDAAWSSAAWSSAAWSDAAWSDAAWASVAYGTAAWSDAAWSDAAWSDAAWADNAGDDAGDTATVDPTDADALIASFGITDPNCDPTLTVCTTTSTTTVVSP
jgi:serine protease AprX